MTHEQLIDEVKKAMLAPDSHYKYWLIAYQGKWKRAMLHYWLVVTEDRKHCMMRVPELNLVRMGDWQEVQLAVHQEMKDWLTRKVGVGDMKFFPVQAHEGEKETLILIAEEDQLE